MLKLLQLITIVLANNNVKYKFFKNFGQVFHDYTENGFNGINGAYRAKDPKDTIPTDRGAYFYGGDKEITMPLSNEENEELIDESKFSVAFWINIQTSTNRLLTSQDSAKISNIFIIQDISGVKFGVYLLSDLKIQVAVKGSSGLKNFYSNNYIGIGIWQFIAVYVKNTNVVLYLNQIEDILYSGTFDYQYIGATSIYIGHQDSIDSFNGYLFLFTLDNDNDLNLEEYIDTSSTTCYYTSGCSSSCTPATVINDTAYCIPIEPEYNKDCPSNCEFGCKDSICLECKCNFLTCVLKDNLPKCWCPDDAVSEETNCACDESDNYFNGYTCENTDTCNNLCLSCKDSICLYCKDLNGNPSDSTCNCPEYYIYNYISSSNYCSKCPDTCLTCDSNYKCLNCISENSEVNNDGKCECSLGFYSVGNLTNAKSCLECHSECESCEEYPKCSTCKSKYAMPDSLNGCSCPENSQLNDSTCVCIDGYYMSTFSNTYKCNECHSTCLTCNQNGRQGCLTCQPSLNHTNGRCECEESFYWNSTSCIPCEENCQVCVSGQKCNECITGYNLNYQGHCEKNCSVPGYYNGEDCVMCEKLCIECDETGCLKCSKNSALDENGVCVCEQGYNGDLICEQQYFKGNLIINKTNIVLLQFEKFLQTELSVYNFSLTISDSRLKYTWIVTEKIIQVFKFRINPSSSIQAGTQVLIEITSNSSIYSVENYILVNKVFIGELKEYKYPYSSSLTTQRLSNITSGLTKAAISSSALSGVLSTPAFLWSFLNTMELIALLPLNAIPYPSSLTEFFNSFVGFSIFPNPMEYIPRDSNLPDAYKEAKNYGFETSLFLYNGGTYIWIFGFFIIVMLITYLGQKVNNQYIVYYSEKIYGKFFFSFFLRFWIQSQLDLGIISLIQLNSVNNSSSPEFYVNLVFSIMIMAIFIFTPILFAIFSYKNKNHIISGTNLVFNKKWGVIFEEFKGNKGIFSTLFYIVFTIRRVMFVFAQVLINKYLYLQAGLNIIFTVLVLVYLFVFLPYKEIEVQISILIGELCTVEIMALSLIFIDSDDSEIIKDIETVIVVSVIITILIQCVISFFLIGKQIRKTYIKYKIRKNSDLSISQSKVKVAPDSTTMNIEWASNCLGDDTLNEFKKMSH